MISVIIPLAPQEDKWKELLPQLADLPPGSEIILVTGIGEIIDITAFKNARAIEGKIGRAGRMNSGAEHAKNDYLWFLHADSRLAEDTIEKMIASFKQNQDALYYSDLKFLSDGPNLMKFNETVVKWRSDVLKMPFGDQGFGVSRKLFFELGGYRDDVDYGEDYVFTWKVRQEGYSIKPIEASIFTSARKYKKGGWLKVTLLHFFLTIKQGWPEFLIWFRKKYL